MQPPRAGSLTVNGSPVRSEAEARAARRHIGYLPQRSGFEPGIRVGDFVRYGAWLRGLPPREWADAARVALDHVALSGETRTKLGRWSGGMGQRATIAWAIAGQPRVVLLDEPTVGLDPQQRVRFRDIIAGLTDTTVLLSTHLIDDVDAICDRVVVMCRRTRSGRGERAVAAVADQRRPVGLRSAARPGARHPVRTQQILDRDLA